MVVINFTVFQGRILAGEKRQTIRRAARCKPGDPLQLYTGMRTKGCLKLGDAVCEAAWPILITAEGFDIGTGGLGGDIGREALAKIDGFDSWADMTAFFQNNYGLPFEGVLIRWCGFVPAGKAVA
jgi:hypothetical protein